ncbi:PIN domain-containing protein [candidate division KSB1 bacterium]|nr:PIN domain-containing protein [candidate division KSB1 bacterium]
MKILIDSSVIIASMIESHPNHDSALLWIERARKEEFLLFVSAHSLLEVYSVLTKAPFKPRISSETAKRLIERNIKNIANIHSLVLYHLPPKIEILLVFMVRHLIVQTQPLNSHASAIRATPTIVAAKRGWTFFSRTAS